MNTTPFRTFAATLAVSAFFLLAAPWAASRAAAQEAPQQPSLAVTRITQPIDDTKLATLKGNVVPEAQAQFDRGAAPVSMPTGRMMLLLKGSVAQQNAKQQYLDSLQNPASPSYHKWLTPAQYGQLYGPTEQDIQAVTAWLQSQGFSVDKVAQARNMIEFSGSVGQLEQAFHTSIHTFAMNGEQHHANISDPQIPAALAPVVAGVASLNDFYPRPGARRGGSAHWDSATKTIKPDLTLQDQNGNNYLYVDPADAATIYDTPSSTLNRNFSSGTSYDGTGITIGIAGDSNITASDVANYRTAFLNQPNPTLPNVIVDGNDPGINGDEIEALLDTEVSGGIAPGATINFYTAADTDFQSGLFLAIYRALDDNAVSILNVSFGACELQQGAAGNQQILAAWQQAAAQGISVTVSTGDSGSANCDDENTETVATNGLAVNGLASTPYNIAVGGTDFDVLQSSSTSFSQYVNTANSGNPPYYGTALSYIPEEPWNDSTVANSTISANTPYKDPTSGATNIVAAGGGLSSAAVCNFNVDENGDCLGNPVGYSKPAFQTSLTPKDSVRDLPDVSFLASDGTYGATWAVCLDPTVSGVPNTDCQTTNGQLTSNTTFSGVGGTSAAAPALAGMLALVAQSQVAQGKSGRLGQADTVLYALAKSDPAIFHDVTTGNNSVYCSTGSPNCGSNSFISGYNTTAGYDTASGLGSVDVAQLVNNWSNVSFTPTTTSLTAGTSTSTLSTASIAVQHGTPIDFSALVAPGAATGTVTIETDSTLPNQGAQVPLTITSGTATGSYNGLPGGQYNIYAYYGGDTTYAASKSNLIPVNISPENSTTSLTVGLYDSTTGDAIQGSSAPYGSYVYADAQPYGDASKTGLDGSITPDGLATGSVTFLNGATTVATANLNSEGVGVYNNNSLAPGNYSFTAKYSGDPGLNPSTSNAVAFTITQAATSLQVTPTSSTIQANGTATLTATLTTTSIGSQPTGTITVKNGSTVVGTPVVLNSTNAVNIGGFVAAQVPLPIAGANLPAGTNNLTIVYSGDANYATSSATSTVTVSGSATGAGLGIAGTNVSITAPGQGGTSTVTVTPSNGFTGAVNLTCAVANPLGTSSPPTCSFASPSVTITNSSPVTATLNIATTTNTARNSSPSSFPLGKFLGGAGGTALAFAFFFGIPARRRNWQAMLGLLIVLVSIAGIGCGSSGGSNNGSTPQNFTATVTATDAATGKITATSTITITVQ